MCAQLMDSCHSLPILPQHYRHHPSIPTHSLHSLLTTTTIITLTPLSKFIQISHSLLQTNDFRGTNLPLTQAFMNLKEQQPPQQQQQDQTDNQVSFSLFYAVFKLSFNFAICVMNEKKKVHLINAIIPSACAAHFISVHFMYGINAIH